MKQIIHTLELLFVALLLSGCTGIIDDGMDGAIAMPGYEVVRAGEPVDVYHLHISFKDADGTDLLEKLAYYKSDPSRQKYWGEVDPALYSLSIIATSLFTPEESFFTLSKYDDNHSWITPDENGYYGEEGTWYLTSKFVYPSKTNGSPYNPLKYRMFCETLFDYSCAYILDTYWEEGTRVGTQHYPECVKAIFDKKEVTPVKGITYNEKNEPYYVGYFLDIVLQK